MEKNDNISDEPIREAGLDSGSLTKLAFIYVKRAKAENNVISHLGVLRVRNDQLKTF